MGRQWQTGESWQWIHSATENILGHCPLRADHDILPHSHQGASKSTDSRVLSRPTEHCSLWTRAYESAFEPAPHVTLTPLMVGNCSPCLSSPVPSASQSKSWKYHCFISKGNYEHSGEFSSFIVGLPKWLGSYIPARGILVIDSLELLGAHLRAQTRCSSGQCPLPCKLWHPFFSQANPLLRGLKL